MFYKKKSFFVNLYFLTEKEQIFGRFFLLFTASVRSRKLGPTLVLGVFGSGVYLAIVNTDFRSLQSLLFTNFGDTQKADLF